MLKNIFFPIILLSLIALHSQAMTISNSCLRSVQDTLYGKIAPDLRASFIRLAAASSNAYHPDGIIGLGALALMQAAGVEQPILSSLGSGIVDGNLDTALELITEKVTLDETPIANIPDLAPAQRFVTSPPVLPDGIAIEPLLGEGDKKNLVQKWGMSEFRMATSALILQMRQPRKLSQTVGPILTSFLELAHHFKKTSVTDSLMVKLIQNGDTPTMVEGAVLLGHDLLLINIARLVLVDCLHDPFNVRVDRVSAMLTGLSSIKDSELQKVARALLYDFAWHFNQPKFFESLREKLNGRALEETQIIHEIEKIKLQARRMGLLALYLCGDEVSEASAEYAYHSPLKLRLLQEPNAKILAQKLIDQYSLEEVRKSEVKNIILWLSASLDLKTKLLNWGEKLSALPTSYDFAAALLYRVGEYDKARAILLKNSVDKMPGALGTIFFDTDYPVVKSAIHIMAEYQDPDGLRLLETSVTERVGALQRAYGELEATLDERRISRAIVVNWELLLNSISAIRKNPSAQSYLQRFESWHLAPKAVTNVHRHSAEVNVQIEILKRMMFDEADRKTLTARGFAALKNKDPLQAAVWFIESGFRAGIIEVANSLAANPKPEFWPQAMQLYVLASHLE